MLKFLLGARYVCLAVIGAGLVLGAGGGYLDWGGDALANYQLLSIGLKALGSGVAALFFVEFAAAAIQRRLSGYIASVFVLLLTTAIGAVVLDVTAGALGLDRSPFDKSFGEKIKRHQVPYLAFKGRPSAPEFEHNELGYRGSAPAMDKRNEYRVLVFGGSTVWNGEPTIPAMLQTLAQADGHSRVRVYNFGVVSSVSRQDVARAVLEGLLFEPDLILMYNGGNDLTSPFWFDPRPGYPYDYFMREANPFLGEASGTGNLLRSLMANSTIGRLLLRNENVAAIAFGLYDLRLEVGFKSADWRDRIARTYLDGQRYLQDLARRMDIRAITVFQPIRAYGPGTRYPEIETVREHLLDLQTREFAELNFIDLSLMLTENGDRSAFTDIIHVTQETRAEIADAIYRQISPELP